MVNIFKDKKFLKECAIILIVGIIVNGLCFLIGTIHSQAADDVVTSLPLPIGVPSGLNIPSDKVDYCKNAYISYLGSNYSHDVSQTYTIFVDQIVNEGTPNETIYITATSGFSVDLSNWNTSLTYTNAQQHYVQFTYYPASDTILGPTFYGGWVNSWTYTPTDLTNYKGWVLSNYSGDIYSGNTLVWTTSFEPTLPEDSEFVPSPLVPTPSDNPKPTAPSITPPTIDTSLSLIDNIKGLFHWLGDTIKSLLKWVVDSIGTFFDNLKHFLKDIINGVITAINNGFNNVYLNFKSLFQPFIDAVLDVIDNINDFFDNTGQRLVNIVTRLGDIFGKLGSLYDKIDGFIDYVKAPLDMNAINTAWVGSAIGGSFTTYYTQTLIVKGLFEQLSNISAPNSLSFTVDFSNAPSPFDTVGSVTFNFDWYENIRYIVTPLISAFIIFGCVMHLIQTLPSIIQGSGSAAEQYQLHNGGITTITVSDRVGTRAHGTTTSTRRRI